MTWIIVAVRVGEDSPDHAVVSKGHPSKADAEALLPGIVQRGLVNTALSHNEEQGVWEGTDPDTGYRVRFFVQLPPGV
jgi:hypothetical protein